MGLLESVRLLGFRRDVPCLLALADVVTLTSKREGLPRAVMEAMTVGKPVVATNVRGNCELVEHGKTGLLVDLSYVDGLAEVVLNLIRNPKLWQKMDEAGRKESRPLPLIGSLQRLVQLTIGFSIRERSTNFICFKDHVKSLTN
ncbi:MAG: glycosyltransferase [Candidatus Caldatribacteriaceae bacterium]